MRLALGTAQFGQQYGIANKTGKVDGKIAQDILYLASKHGIDTLDTAIAYGDSEAVLGMSGVGNWKIVTKLPAIPETVSDIDGWIFDEIKKSLLRLKVGKIYGVLLHQPSQLNGQNGFFIYSALKNLQDRGLVTKIGVSIYSPKELDLIFKKYFFEIVQAPISIIDRRIIESGWANSLKEMGVELHARSVFLQGLMLMPENLRPAAFQAWQDVWEVWDDWLRRYGLSPLEACLRYFISIRAQVDRVIVGVDSMQNLSDILNVNYTPLSSLPDFGKLQDERLINPSLWKMS